MFTFIFFFIGMLYAGYRGCAVFFITVILEVQELELWLKFYIAILIMILSLR